jgi:hypothetical protein
MPKWNDNVTAVLILFIFCCVTHFIVQQFGQQNKNIKFLTD